MFWLRGILAARQKHARLLIICLPCLGCHVSVADSVVDLCMRLFKDGCNVVGAVIIKVNIIILLFL